MPDNVFYKNICLILCDLFGYRIDMSPKQFFDIGCAEKKLILILDIYDILKKCRKGLKINNNLVRVTEGVPHAADESRKEYQIVNHKENLAKNMLFKINVQTEKRTLTV
jgi:hypothetical protein